MALYLSMGLTAKKVSEILAEIVEMVDKKMKDEDMLKNISETFKEKEAVFAAYTLGRIVGMSLAMKDLELVKMIVSDFARYLEVLRKDGKELLKRLIEKETLEETFKDVERLRDVV